MSGAGGPTVTGLPVIAQASEPAWVRNGPAATKKSYEEALAFESVLVEELASSLASAPSSGEQGEGAPGEESSSNPEAGMSALAPQALSSAIMRNGGLGLAAQLTRGLDHTSAPAAASAGASGGTSASVSAATGAEATS